MKTLTDFLKSHPVFRLEELLEASSKPAAVRALLKYQVAQGRLRGIRRGIYATMDELDPWLLASRLSSDAVLAYDGAFSFHGLGMDDVHISFLTETQAGRFNFESVLYTPMNPPAALGKRWRTDVIKAERNGTRLFVTSVERTLVDLLDRLDTLQRGDSNSTGVEQLRLCFKSRGLDTSRMVRHACALGGSLLASRLGFFLEHLPNTDPADLARLERQLRPSPGYFQRREREDERMIFLRRWNLNVPKPLWLRVARGANY